MGAIDSVIKNARGVVIGAGLLAMFVVYADPVISQNEQEAPLQKINVSDLPSIRPEWQSITYFVEGFAAKLYNVDGEGKANIRFVHTYLSVPALGEGTRGFSYGPAELFGCDIDGNGRVEAGEMFEVDYSNSQPRLDLDCGISKEKLGQEQKVPEFD